jgi:hypothetical protein
MQAAKFVVRRVIGKREYYWAQQWLDLNDLREMRDQGIRLIIRDHDTGEDITRIVLA